MPALDLGSDSMSGDSCSPAEDALVAAGSGHVKWLIARAERGDQTAKARIYRALAQQGTPGWMVIEDRDDAIRALGKRLLGILRREDPRRRELPALVSRIGDAVVGKKPLADPLEGIPADDVAEIKAAVEEILSFAPVPRGRHRKGSDLKSGWLGRERLAFILDPVSKN